MHYYEPWWLVIKFKIKVSSTDRDFIICYYCRSHFRLLYALYQSIAYIILFVPCIKFTHPIHVELWFFCNTSCALILYSSCKSSIENNVDPKIDSSPIFPSYNVFNNCTFFTKENWNYLFYSYSFNNSFSKFYCLPCRYLLRITHCLRVLTNFLKRSIRIQYCIKAYFDVLPINT